MLLEKFHQFAIKSLSVAYGLVDVEEKKRIQYISPIIIITITSITLIDPLVMDSDFILMSFVNEPHETVLRYPNGFTRYFLSIHFVSL